MSLRGVWMLTLPGNETGRLLFSRIFPTVEKKVQDIEGESYIPVPDNYNELACKIYETLALNQLTNEFVKARDSCIGVAEKPVYEIDTTGGKLWPFVIVEQHGFLYCCLPFVVQGSHNRPPVIQIPGVSSGISLLLGMAEFLGTIPRNIDENSSKFVELSLYVSQAAPFGSPVDVNIATVQSAIFGRAGPMPPQNQKQPAWKPRTYKGKNQIHFTIKEVIRAVQYDKSDTPDVWDVYGTISCRADLEGQMPDVSITLNHVDEILVTPVENLLLHPCVQSVEPSNHATNSHRLRFSPPLETFKLCQYTANMLPAVPIKGFYQMKGETSVNVLVQLKLNDQVKNNFDYCELQLPFHNRGLVTNWEASPSHGNVLLSHDKKVLVWNIGQKFPSKTLEVMLKASLQFEMGEKSVGSRLEEQFCKGNNSYAQLLFKISDFTHTGVTVDSKTTQVTPATKFKLVTVREYSSNDYKIWNSHGDVLSVYLPPQNILT